MITIDDLRWHHAGLDAFAMINHYTIRDAILTNPNAELRYSIWEKLDGDEAHVASYPNLDDVLDHLNRNAQ